MDVHADSPHGALRADGALVSPGPLELDRGSDHVLTLEEPGREPVSTNIERKISWGYLALDGLVAVITFPIGLIAPIVDFADGAIWNLEPEQITFPTPPPPRSAPY